MLQNEAYRKSMTTRACQGYGNCERKAKVNNNTHKWKEEKQMTRNYTWSAHGSSGCILVTLCQATKSTYSHRIVYKINISAWNHNEVRYSEDHSAKHTCFSKRKWTLYKRCVFNKHVHCSSTAHDVASNTVVHISTLMFIHVTWNDTYIDHVLVKNNDFRN